MIKLFKFLKPFRFIIIIVLALTFLHTISQLYLPTLLSDIVDTGIVNGDTGYILRLGGLMLLVAAAGTVCTVAASYLSSKAAVGFGRDIRSKLFSHIEGFSLNEFDRVGTASLITRTTNDVTQVQNVIIMILRIMISAPMMCVGGIIMAVSKDAKLTLLLVVVIPVLAVVILAIARKGIPLFRTMQKKLDKLNLVLRENLTGVRVIRAFNRTEHENRRFENANRDLTDTAIKVNKILALMMPLMMLLFNLTSIAVIWFGSIRIDNGNMQVGDLMAFLQYVMQIMFSILMVSMMFVILPRASASSARINEVLDIEPEINDPEEPVKIFNRSGFVEFREVCFSYSGAEQPAVQDITFNAAPGEITAIIGGTGSGKTTMVNLISRFYDVTAGSVIVDGIDVRDIAQEELRAKIGFVPQQSLLFTGTIEDNIKYGKEDASDEQIRHAAEVAQAGEFISNMEDGYNSIISQGGTNISGGQKQRLSIARALVRKPEIYIFDDSFSALDFKTDARLRSALKKEIKDSTVFIVAQRVSTVMDADRIIVLDDGKIAGMGRHRELLDSCEVYREIVYSQLSEEEIA